MELRFTIIDRNNVATVVDEPTGWDAVEIKLSRDKNLHGLFFDFQTNQFTFSGPAFDLIKAENDNYGVEGKMSLKVEYRCGRAFKQFYTGSMLFTKVEEDCGADCSITISIEGSGAQIALNNRLEQKVDLEDTKCFDKITDLAAYDKLAFPITLPSKAILLKSEAVTDNNNSDDYDIATDSEFVLFPSSGTAANDGIIVPKFEKQNVADIIDFKNPFQFDYVPGAVDAAIEEMEIISINTPVLSVANTYNVSLRLKGNLYVKYGVGGVDSASIHVKLSIGLKYGPAKTEAFAPVLVEEFIETFFGGPHEHNIPFDFTWTGSFDLNNGEKIWPYFILHTTDQSEDTFPHILQLKISQTTDSFFKVNSTNIAAPSQSKAFMINEATSRVIESITNNQLKLYSEWLGRTDSQPFNFDVNGCGALRILLNGLYVRSATLTDGSDPKIFISLKDILDALSSIDNIGMGFEGTDKVRIENWKYFYKDNIMLICSAVDFIKTTVKEADHIAVFRFGYEKWEAEQYNGLDELLTKREYRTQLTQVSNPLEKICKWIASPYAYEVTRRQGPSSKDWRYDNDIFILCTTAGYEVEQGNLTDAVNIVDPPTMINFRISPLRNALKWMDTIMASYKKTLNTNKLIFSSADGNYIAEGNMTDDVCKLEAGTLKENQDLDNTVFVDATDGTPIKDLQTKEYQYPLEMEEFMAILADPYGLIQYDCAEEPGAAWIDSLTYRPNDGLATFTLTPKRGWSA